MTDHRRIVPWSDRVWWSVISYPENSVPPLTEGGLAAEPDEPWRRGRCWILRMPRSRKALALGFWGRPHPVDIDEDGTSIMRLRPIRWKDVLHDRKKDGG